MTRGIKGALMKGVRRPETRFQRLNKTKKEKGIGLVVAGATTVCLTRTPSMRRVPLAKLIEHIMRMTEPIPVISQPRVRC